MGVREIKTRDDLVRWLDEWDVPSEALIEHLDEAGVALVPKEPTAGMVGVHALDLDDETVTKVLQAGIAASPYRSKL